MYVSIIFAAESQSPRASFSLHALPELEQTDWKQYTQVDWLPSAEPQVNHLSKYICDYTLSISGIYLIVL